MSDAILVAGATGRIGGATLQALVEAGAEPLALLRNPGRRAALPHPVQVRHGDLADPASLTDTFDAIDRLLLSSGHGPGMLEVQRNAIEAARRSGVRRIVKISGSPASTFAATPSAVAAQHFKLEMLLKDSGIEWTAIRPNAFMQLLATWQPAIVAGRLPLTLGDAAVSWVDSRDVGAVAAQALTHDGPLPPVIEVTGPEALTGDELAGALSDALHHEVRYEPVSDDAHRATLEASGAPRWLVDHVITIFALLRDRDGDRVTDGVEHWTGRPPSTVAQVLGRDELQFGLAAAVHANQREIPR